MFNKKKTFLLIITLLCCLFMSACQKSAEEREKEEEGLRIVFLLGLPNNKDLDDQVLMKIYDEIISIAGNQEMVQDICQLDSAREFYEEIEFVRQQIREEQEKRRETSRNYLFDHMDEDLVKEMEEIRLGKKDKIGDR